LPLPLRRQQLVLVVLLVVEQPPPPPPPLLQLEHLVVQPQQQLPLQLLRQRLLHLEPLQLRSLH
jgi:hypothetical protein